MVVKSKTKIYYWLKFDKHFFDNLFIKRLLRNFPGGSDMIIIYIRLMLEAIENDCIIDYEGTFDSYAEELALRLEVSEEQINMALAYFVKCGVIQIDNDGNTHYPQAKALLGQETNWNRYKRKQAELENFQPPSNHLPTDSNHLPTDIDIDKEKKLDINLDIKSEVEVEKIGNSTTADEKSNFNVFDYYQQRIGMIDGYQYQKLKDYLEYDHFEEELIKIAIDKAADNSKRNFGYINTILKNWAQNGITTVVQQNEEQRNYEEAKAKRNQKPEREATEYDDLF